MNLCEEAFENKSKKGNEAVLGLINSLSSALVYPDAGNFQTNKKLWSFYAKDWDSNGDWVQDIARGSYENENNTIESEEHIPPIPPIPLKVLGEEWSKSNDLQEVIDEFILPYAVSESGEPTIAAEVGCGGGRVAARVAGLFESLDCFDISPEMIQHAREATKEFQNVQFFLLESPEFPNTHAEKYDFIYCFDVMVHMDLHLIYKYLLEFYKLLKPGGKVFFSTANLLAPGGWDRFRKQKKYTVGGFYFLSPDIARHLIAQAGFVHLHECLSDKENVYYQRDFLVVAQKPLFPSVQG